MGRIGHSCNVTTLPTRERIPLSAKAFKKSSEIVKRLPRKFQKVHRKWKCFGSIEKVSRKNTKKNVFTKSVEKASNRVKREISRKVQKVSRKY